MNRNTLWKAIPIVLFVAAVGGQAFGPHPIGKSDNGDFPKVLGRMGIWVAPEFKSDLFGFFVTDYRIDDSHIWNPNIPGTEVWISWVAKGICKVLLPDERFDIRILGVLHALIFTAAFWLSLIPLDGLPWQPRVLLTTVFLLVLADPQYVQFFSTAYMDTASMVFLALLFAVAWNASLSANYRWAAAFCVVGMLFLGTKLQHQTCLIPFVFFSLVMAWRATGRAGRTAWLVVPVGLVAASSFMWWKTPAGYRVEPLFSAIYFKLLPIAEKPDLALQQLNRPAGDIAYNHTWAYSEGSPLGDAIYRAEFLQSVTTGRVLAYYMAHPGTAFSVMRKDFLAFAADVPISSFGTMRRVDRPEPLFRAAGIQPWSWLRRQAALLWPWHILVFYFAVCLCFRSRLWPLALMVAAIGLTSFAAGSLLDATETSRHIVLYQEATDFLFVVGLAMACFKPIS